MEKRILCECSLNNGKIVSLTRVFSGSFLQSWLILWAPFLKAPQKKGSALCLTDIQKEQHGLCHFPFKCLLTLSPLAAVNHLQVSHFYEALRPRICWKASWLNEEGESSGKIELLMISLGFNVRFFNTELHWCDRACVPKLLRLLNHFIFCFDLINYSLSLYLCDLLVIKHIIQWGSNAPITTNSIAHLVSCDPSSEYAGSMGVGLPE